MSKAHYDALEALLPDGFTRFRGVAEGEASEGNPDGEVNADDYPFIVLGGNLGRDSTEAMNGDPDTREMRFRITYSGLTFDSVLIVLEAVRTALNGKKLVVQGWSSGILRQEELLDIRADRDVTIPGIGLHPQFAVDEFTLVSAR
ncbi:hypothetical protein QEH68_06725 [Paenarthrobacter sp. OM7]|uniref:hypothetical protein n=1 Tax=Paenarthrobacter sp. OM7 TaxID=3041264 RepID=UPI0024692D7A|nr:hypothetical protein [Paenarthrobacter sp. OM7]WGM21862.1 hypothetical protein QEH68_06725 [Paenarthrobacter sp. OM7]